MSAGQAVLLAGGPGEESASELSPVGSTIQFLAVVRLGTLSPFSVSAGGCSGLLEATHIPGHMTPSISNAINRDSFVH